MMRPFWIASAPALGRAVLTVTCALLAGGCVATPPPVTTPTPAEVPALEARLGQQPRDARTRVLLAAAYRDGGRAADAVALLTDPAAAGDDAAKALLLGLAYEDLSRFSDARRQYERYLSHSRAASHAYVRGRLVALERRELQAAIRAAVAREAELTLARPAPRSVAVFPFVVNAADEQLRPLGTALAELLTTDLALSGRLRVLERTQLSLLLEEIELGESGTIDGASAARAGHLLSAGRLVQGRVDGSVAALDVQALVVPVPLTDSAGAPIHERGPLDRIFDMQANLALAVHDELGLELTVAERQRLLQRPTQNVQALLAFGFGLEAMDAGRLAEAIAHFERAVRLDPGFQQARARLSRARDLAVAATVPATRLGEVALLDLVPAIAPWRQDRMRFLDVDAMVPSPDVRDPTAELLGTETIERRPVLEVIIRRPGGGP